MISPSEMIEAIKSWCKSKFITEIPIGSSETVGGVKADGSTTTIDDDGTIHATGGSGSGTSDYNALSNRPSIEGVTLSGNKTLSELGIQPEGTYLIEETDPTVPDWAKAGSKPSYTADEVGADKSGTAESKVSAHNTSTDSHSDIRLLIEGLQSKVNAVLDSDDETLDQMSEIVAYIKDNKELIEAITTDKVSVSDIVNNLTTNVSDKPLSAAQGVALKALIDGIVVPAKISELTNDSGYITGISKSDVVSALGYTPPKEDTNTTYSDMTGATSSTAGKAGLVPAPAAGDNDLYFKGDGTYENADDHKAVFTEATERVNIASGEKLSVLFGKIMKWFTDLKSHAFVTPIANLLTTVAGSALDATMGKELDDKIAANTTAIEEVNSSLSTITKGSATIDSTLVTASYNLISKINKIAIMTLVVKPTDSYTNGVSIGSFPSGFKPNNQYFAYGNNAFIQISATKILLYNATVGTTYNFTAIYDSSN